MVLTALRERERELILQNPTVDFFLSLALKDYVSAVHLLYLVDWGGRGGEET